MSNERGIGIIPPLRASPAATRVARHRLATESVPSRPAQTRHRPRRRASPSGPVRLLPRVMLFMHALPTAQIDESCDLEIGLVIRQKSRDHFKGLALRAKAEGRRARNEHFPYIGNLREDDAPDVQAQKAARKPYPLLIDHQMSRENIAARSRNRPVAGPLSEPGSLLARAAQSRTVPSATTSASAPLPPRPPRSRRPARPRPASECSITRESVDRSRAGRFIVRRLMIVRSSRPKTLLFE